MKEEVTAQLEMLSTADCAARLDLCLAGWMSFEPKSQTSGYTQTERASFGFGMSLASLPFLTDTPDEYDEDVDVS